MKPTYLPPVTLFPEDGPWPKWLTHCSIGMQHDCSIILASYSTVSQEVIQSSTHSLVEQGWQLESCKVFNHPLWCHHFLINIFHITIATPYPNCKPSTFWRRLSQVSPVPLNDISLFNAFKFKYFLLRKVKHIPAKQWFLCYCENIEKN